MRAGTSAGMLPGMSLVAYGTERYARLVAVKDRWDPENVFRLDHNRPSI